MGKQIVFATGFDPEDVREARGLAAGLECKDDSLASQADAKDADINVIMDRYARTGQMPVISRLPSFGDFTGISDYREALEAVRSAEGMFLALPAKVRARFENDPQQFVEFCQVEGNRLELAEMGLLSQEVVREIKEAAKVKQEPTSGNASGVAGGAASSSRDDGDPGFDGSKRPSGRAKPSGGA